jgi:protein CpxP
LASARACRRPRPVRNRTWLGPFFQPWDRSIRGEPLPACARLSLAAAQTGRNHRRSAVTIPGDNQANRKEKEFIMFKTNERPGRMLAATALFGVLIVAAPAYAQTPSPAPTTTAPTTAPVHKTPAKAAAKQMTPAERVEAHIADLHRQLKITADQEPKWTAFAQVMRDNAQKLDTLHQQRRDNQSNMSAVDDLRSYRDIAQARAEEAQALVAAFESLYDSMTPDQKKNADMVFAKAQGPRGRTPARTNVSKKS